VAPTLGTTAIVHKDHVLHIVIMQKMILQHYLFDNLALKMLLDKCCSFTFTVWKRAV